MIWVELLPRFFPPLVVAIVFVAAVATGSSAHY